jgi:anoctamin-10
MRWLMILAVMALINNVLEIRSDAFKIAVHNRRPIPIRTDTIGPWLDSLAFLTWLSALTNAALVYLYRPHAEVSFAVHEIEGVDAHSVFARSKLLLSALLIALAASHGYFIVRAMAQHIVERAMWRRSTEVAAVEESEKAVKEQYLRSLGEDDDDVISDKGDEGFSVFRTSFWAHDEGKEEIQKLVKEA